MIYFTSDLHLNNNNIIKYSTRPFNSIEEMNTTIIANWNNVVTDIDTVYVLGDFIMGDADKVNDLLSQLNGQIILIRGNHDTNAKLKIYQDKGIIIKEIEYLFYKEKVFILNHFPPVWDSDFFKQEKLYNKEIVYLYGHIHNNAPKGFYENSFHVGVDTNNFTPISIKEIYKSTLV